MAQGLKVANFKFGSDEHLSLLGAPYHLNMLTGQDRADLLAFGRDCITAERERWAGVEQYLEAAASGSMSRNNSEELAAELLAQIRAKDEPRV